MKNVGVKHVKSSLVKETWKKRTLIHGVKYVKSALAKEIWKKEDTIKLTDVQ